MLYDKDGGMYMGYTTENFIKKVEKYGYKVRVISFSHIEEIKSDIENTKRIYSDVNDNVGRYINGFNYNGQKSLLEDKSIIVVAVPQPIGRIHFSMGVKKLTAILPPMYLYNTGVELEEKHKKISKVTTILKNILSEDNYKVTKTNLPCKLIAVRSGLGAYGRNNICYINNESSFYWIGIYVSDMPCEDDSWQGQAVMDACEKCDLCMKNCPTGAIGKDRFIVHADRCITIHNERDKDFPQYINPKWHNSLIGCMRCQIICPVNKNYIKNVEDLVEFDDSETRAIFAKTPLAELPEATYKKIELISFTDYYELLARNLDVLIK